MEIILSLGGGLKEQDESYMFINFEDTKNAILGLMQNFHQAGKKCELYPTAAKLGKQFEYADKKGVRYCVVYGAGEIEKSSYIIKDLKTGTSYEGFFDAAYGIIPICDIDGEKRVLMIKHNAGHRGFPKGHAEQGENALIAAVRECQEEVGLQHMNVYQEKSISESYFIADPKKALPTTGVAPRNILKTITYFIAHVENLTIKIQPEEVADAQWLTLAEAKELPMFAQMRCILVELQKFL